MVRTLACHARGQGFEPPLGRQQNASVAQLVEQGTENPRVVGSIPTGGTTHSTDVLSVYLADLAHLVERDLAKVEVAGSSPVIRSKQMGFGYPEPIFIRRHSQAVRQRSAKPLSPGPIPGGASEKAPFGVLFQRRCLILRVGVSPVRSGQRLRCGSVVNDDPGDRQSRTGTEPAGESAVGFIRRFRGKKSPILPLVPPLSDRKNRPKIIKINRYEIGFEGF